MSKCVILLTICIAVSLVYCGEEIPSICLEPITSGPCRANKPSFGYNSETKKCESFIYGGCQGNSNRFRSIVECEETCKVR